MKKNLIHIALAALGAICLLVVYALINAWSYSSSVFNPPVKPAETGVLSLNKKLEKAKQLSLGGYFGPEDIAEKGGYLYCGARQYLEDFHQKGKILKINPKTGEAKVWASLPAWIGAIQFDKKGNLIACVMGKGLASIDSSGQVSWLATQDGKGNQFKIPNDIDIASNGDIYFSVTDADYDFSIDNMVKIMASAQPRGGVYCYKNATGKIELIAKDFLGINGIALTKNEKAIIAVEMGAYRLTRIELKGTKKGKREIIAENLPGFANNIVRRTNGDFWLAFSTLRIDEIDLIHPYPSLKKIAMGLPNFLKLKPIPYGLLLQINEQGKILNSFFDVDGKVVSEMSSVYEYDGKLYMGGDNIMNLNYIDIP
jgi:sugar lactone lactonase YvrE